MHSVLRGDDSHSYICSTICNQKPLLALTTLLSMHSDLNHQLLSASHRHLPRHGQARHVPWRAGPIGRVRNHECWSRNILQRHILHVQATDLGQVERVVRCDRGKFCIRESVSGGRLRGRDVAMMSCQCLDIPCTAVTAALVGASSSAERLELERESEVLSSTFSAETTIGWTMAVPASSRPQKCCEGSLVRSPESRGSPQMPHWEARDSIAGS